MSNCFWMKHKTQPKCSAPKGVSSSKPQSFLCSIPDPASPQGFLHFQGCFSKEQDGEEPGHTAHNHAKCKTPAVQKRRCCPMQRGGSGASQTTQDLDLQCPVLSLHHFQRNYSGWRRPEEPLCANSQWVRCTNHKLSGSATPDLL